MTGLAWACQNHHERIARILLAAKPNIHMTDLLSRSPIYFAVKSKNFDLVKEMLKMKANPWSVTGQPSFIDLCDDDPRIMALIEICRTVYNISKLG
jgi:ankyrin repeat protein